MRAEIKRADPATEYETPEHCLILELSNDAGDPAVSIARTRVLPGVTTEWHMVRGTAERYLITGGEGLVEVEGLPATTVRPGDVVRIPPGAAQRIGNTGEGDLVFFCVCTPRFEADCYVALEEPDGD